MILLLAVAGALAFAFADQIEAMAIFVVILINASIGFLTEWRAIRSMEALGRLGRMDTVVMRDGLLKQIPASALVPGDIVVFEGGEIVTADIRLLEAAKLQADESTLTGESMPVGKETQTLPPDAAMMSRSNLVFKGTAITRGSGKGVVVGTGLNTELGRISQLVTEAEALQTPLEKRLDALAQRLVWVVVVLAVLIAVAGILVGRETSLAIEVAIALAVAAIPEGLPIVATIALARGMWRMARRNALIAKLSAVETLGATSVILTDKTGTLTENRMAVTAIRLPDANISIENAGFNLPGRITEDGNDLGSKSSAYLDKLLTISALCSNASVHRMRDGGLEAVGDPTEVALLVAGESRNIHREDLTRRTPEIIELSFDPETKLMATLHKDGPDVLVAVKGAPEAVIPCCSTIRSAAESVALQGSDQQEWLEHAQSLGARGLRTLAIATKRMPDTEGEPYRELQLLGVVGLEDPPRKGVKSAIQRCRDAGIFVVMVTGDHAATARNIAGEVGIVEAGANESQFIDGAATPEKLNPKNVEELSAARVFSRVSPEQKLNLIDFCQQQGLVVAMTGDGVNDAPALKKADIGVAMGIRGTDVAKEAAAMVLRDDEFGTIVEAVSQGRAIYGNIRKFVVYLLSCNISEVLVVSIATVAGAPLPLLPLQILFLNLVTDVFPALALGVGEGSPLLMKEKPRPADEPLLTRAHWLRIFLYGIVMSISVLGAMALAVYRLDFATDRAITVSFCTLALAQLWHVFNMRNNLRRLINNEITRNPWIWLAILICLALILSAVYTPLLSGVLQLHDPGPEGWLVIFGMSLIPIAAAPIVRIVAPRPASV